MAPVRKLLDWKRHQREGLGVVFPSKKDWFTYPVLLASLGLIVLGIFFLAVPPPKPEEAVALTVAGCVMPVIGGLLLWVFFATTYVIQPPHLVVRFGPLRWRVPLEAIVEAVPRETMFPLDWGWSVAWSLDRVCVRYRKRNGKMASALSISPQDKSRFLRELRKACPGLKT
jgi:hypothetical protein